jgi:hypothetical protein
MHQGGNPTLTGQSRTGVPLMHYFASAISVNEFREFGTAFVDRGNIRTVIAHPPAIDASW